MSFLFRYQCSWAYPDNINSFKIISTNTRTTESTPFSSVSIVEFEQVTANKLTDAAFPFPFFGGSILKLLFILAQKAIIWTFLDFSNCFLSFSCKYDLYILNPGNSHDIFTTKKEDHAVLRNTVRWYCFSHEIMFIDYCNIHITNFSEIGNIVCLNLKPL